MRITRFESGWHRVFLAVAILLLGSACRDRQGPGALVQAAIEAHGGRERLAVFDNLRVAGRSRFRGTLPTTGTISFVEPDTWAAEARLEGQPVIQFGMDGGRCWRRDRQFVVDCGKDESDSRRFGELLRLRLLHGLEEREFASAGERDVGGVSAPAVRTGDFVLAFDPVSHRLIEISSANWVEVYSDFRNVDGAIVAAGRTFYLDGELDVEESWDEILPGKADLDLLHPPLSPKDGDTFSDVDPERWVITTAIREPAFDLNQAIGSLDGQAREHGQKVSASEGFVLTELPPQPAGEAKEWEISIGLEPTTGGLPSVSGAPFRFERWPEGRFANVFHRGDPRDAMGKRSLLQKYLDERRLEPASGARWQIICRRDSPQSPVAERLCLLRVAVTEASGTTAAADG